MQLKTRPRVNSSVKVFNSNTGVTDLGRKDLIKRRREQKYISNGKITKGMAEDALDYLLQS